MKKLLSIILVLSLIISLTGCCNNVKETEESKILIAAAEINDTYDLTFKFYSGMDGENSKAYIQESKTVSRTYYSHTEEYDTREKLYNAMTMYYSAAATEKYFMSEISELTSDNYSHIAEIDGVLYTGHGYGMGPMKKYIVEEIEVVNINNTTATVKAPYTVLLPDDSINKDFDEYTMVKENSKWFFDDRVL